MNTLPHLLRDCGVLAQRRLDDLLIVRAWGAQGSEGVGQRAVGSSGPGQCLEETLRTCYGVPHVLRLRTVFLGLLHHSIPPLAVSLVSVHRASVMSSLLG